MAGKQRGRAETIFWISFADLTTCLMMCFMLIFLCVSFIAAQREARFKEVSERLAKTPNMLDTLASLEAQVSALKAVTAENIALKAKITVAEGKALKIDTSVRPVLSAKRQLDQALLNVIASAEKLLIDASHCEGIAKFTVNMEDLAITIQFKKGNLSWFKAGSAIPEPAGTECLKKFVPIWLGELYKLRDSRGYIEQLVVEGHTDSTAPNKAEAFLYNLKLSQDRALEVARFILDETDGIPLASYGEYSEVISAWKPFKAWLQAHLSGTGRSFSRLKYRTVSGRKVEDREKSRRVEFKIVMKDQLTVIKQISEVS